jgi:hypothetical protein
MNDSHSHGHPQAPLPPLPAQAQPRLQPQRPAAQGTVQPPVRPAPSHGPGPARIAPVPHQAPPPANDPSTAPIDLVDEAPQASSGIVPSSKIKFGPGEMSASQRKYRRQTFASGQGACRVRSFHGRLSDEGLVYMDDKINEWLDGHPEIEVKLVTTSIGQYEGKIREPALIVNVWY